MLEEVAERLIAALNANTIAHGGTPPGAARTATAAGKPAPAKPDKVTFEMVKAALVGVKDALGKPAAVKIIKEAGKVAEMSAIKPANFAAVITACENAMVDADVGGEDGIEDDEI